MDDINSTTEPSRPEISKREAQLMEKLGTRLLLIWILGLVASIELLMIAHILRH
ncbi:hypothetical protein [Hyphomicrobium sp. ghe19]|uniref:hypothetical protein n=1 Tax=Hyphomicrobium sp. ghe19 TaxID=2682968 RepID=UPI0013674B82|nr:hypothetical protein HYPP_03738 [Hyphomicrobium sp. ghe19]